MDMGDELRAIATTLSFPKAVLSFSEEGENSSSEEINALKKDIAKGRKLKSVLFRDEVEDRASQESVSLVVEAKNDIQKYLALYAMLRLGVATGRTIVFVRAVEEAYRMHTFLERFSIKAAVLNTELPINTQHSAVNGLSCGQFSILIMVRSAATGARKGELPSPVEKLTEQSISCTVLFSPPDTVEEYNACSRFVD